MRRMLIPHPSPFQRKEEAMAPGSVVNYVVRRRRQAPSCGRRMADDVHKSNTQAPRRYTWPWWALGAVVLATVLAVLWMSQEIARTRRIRDLNAPPPTTNHSAPTLPSR